MIYAVIIGIVTGAAVGVIVARFYIDTETKDVWADAYERGWGDGYSVGINQPKQSRPRAKKISKAVE